MPSKKRKLIDRDVRWLLFSPYDNLFGYVRVDRTILDPLDCRSSKMVRSDPPHAYYKGMPVWYVNLTHSMLVAFVKSMTSNEMVIPRDTSYEDAVRMLDYEGIGCPGNDIAESKFKSSSLLNPHSLGFGYFKPDESQAERVALVSTHVANAIVEWPRPRIMLSDTLNGASTPTSCSSSRFWVRFAPRSRMEKYGGDEVFQLAKKRPMWLERMLGAIGYVHCDLVRRGALEKSARNEPSFTALANYIKEKDPTSYFLSVKRDMPKHHRELNREVIHRADKWAAWVLSMVEQHGSAHELVQLSPTDERKARRGGGDEQTQYARAAIALAEREMARTPNCYRMYSGECSDDDKRGSTPERKVLEKCLKARGARVVRWSESGEEGSAKADVMPLIFPPAFFSHLVGDGPCVLIEMELKPEA